MSIPPADGRAEVLVVEGTPIGQVCRDIAACFRAAGLESPELDARLLVCHGCTVTHEHLISDPGCRLDATQAQNIQAMAHRRLAREPVSRIMGHREFRGLEFTLGPETLDPRPDTETLVEAALEIARSELAKGELTILDLGTGSGCILVALLHALHDARGVGVDISPGALDVARKNAKANAVAERSRFIRSEWASGVEGGFSLVVSNPPYIPTGEISGLQPEVSHFDPCGALDGGEDGLAAYRQIIPGLGSVLLPGGWMLLEVGAGQANDVIKILHGAHGQMSLGEVRQWQDLSGQVRCVGAKRSPNGE